MIPDAQALARRGGPLLLVAIGGAVVLVLALLPVLAGAIVIVPVLAGAAGASAVACPTSTPTPALVATMTGGTVTPTPPPSRPTPTPTAISTSTPDAGSPCINLDANRIVFWAMQAAAHLYDCPPQMLDECYDAGFPQPLIAWWEQTCPGCSQWQNGNLQCVMLAGAVFGVAGLPLYWGPDGVANGIDFWYNYASYPGWTEIPAAFEPGTLVPAPLSARGLPAPGDLIAWYDRFAPREGHLAVVAQVVPPQPQAGQAGTVTFVEANGPGALVTEPLKVDLTVSTWTGYVVAGYIRPLNMPPA
jgi:hypothetical protein